MPSFFWEVWGEHQGTMVTDLFADTGSPDYATIAAALNLQLSKPNHLDVLFRPAYVDIRVEPGKKQGPTEEQFLSLAIPLLVEHQLRILPEQFRNSVLIQLSSSLIEYGKAPLALDGRPQLLKDERRSFPRVGEVKTEVYFGRSPYALVWPRFHGIPPETGSGILLWRTVLQQLPKLSEDAADLCAFLLAYGVLRWKDAPPRMGRSTWDFSNIDGMMEEGRRQGWWYR